MRTTLEHICNEFIRNRDIVKSVFKWEDDQIISASVATFLNREKYAFGSKLERCAKMIKENTSVFSSFRENVKVPVAVHMSIDDDPEEKIAKIMRLYDTLKREFHGSEYLVLAAVVMSDMISENSALEITKKARNIYDKMKKDHPFLTSSEDTIYAVIMAMSEKSDEIIMDEMEICYKKIKENFSSSNDVQALAHVLSIADGSVEEKCDKVVALYNALKFSEMKYGKHHELMALASLAMLPVDQSILVDDIKEVDAFLAGQKGYGFFAQDKKTRLMHAAMIVSCDYIKNDTSDIAVMAGALAAVAAQQAAMCAMIATTTTVATTT